MSHIAEARHAETTHELVFPWKLVRGWLLANVVAFTVGFGVAGTLLRALVQPAIENAPTRMDVAWIAGISTAVAAVTSGTAIGFAQWLVLRQAIRAAWWVPATVVGWTVACFVVGFNSGGSSWQTMPEAGPIMPFVPPLLILPVVIVVVGGGQWLVLRRECAGASWWLLVNAGASCVALVTGFGVAKSMSFLAPTDFPSGKALVIVGGIAGPIYGYVTWLFLSQLRRRRT
jgi:hypothetical protein